MSPAEEALIAASPTFPDLCDRVRIARRSHALAMTSVRESQKRFTATYEAMQAAEKALGDFVNAHIGSE